MNSPARPSADPLARVDVLIVNYNAGDWLGRCIASLRPGNAAEPNVIVVDNGSTDDSVDRLEAGRNADQNASRKTDRDTDRPGARLTIDRSRANPGFAAGVNRAATHAGREFILILNPDCLITPTALARLVAELDRHPETALVSGKVLGRDGREQRGSRRRLPTPARILAEMLPLGRPGIDQTSTPAPARPIAVEALSGACMLVRSEALERIGGFDEGYPLHFEDLDLFARLGQAGWTLRWVPDAEIVHAGGESSATRPVAVLWAKHRGLWRYLRKHCAEAWPGWQRPLWFIALVVNASVRTPLAWALALARRGGSR